MTFHLMFVHVVISSVQIDEWQPFGKSLYLLSPRLCFFIVLRRDVFVCRDDSSMSERVIMRTEQSTKWFLPLQKLRARLAP